MGVHHRDTGDFICGATEAEVFEAVGLRYVAPEIRENIGEVEAAEEDRLPDLIELEDIRGDLHMHTTKTDGRNTIIEMAEGCQAIGYEYIAITDHSKAMAIANGLDAQRLTAHLQEIDKVNDKLEIRILRAVEVDILRDGSLDLDDGILAECEWVIASVHSHMQISAEEMTTRLLRAIENPNVCAIAHPTARLILEREGYSYDTVKVFEAARDAGVCMEINANPARLDLKDVHARQVRELGGRLVINTDAHLLRELDNMKFGVWTARRGWVGVVDVLNTLSLDELLDAKR
jgi:DNA polymerase (family 10)